MSATADVNVPVAASLPKNAAVAVHPDGRVELYAGAVSLEEAQRAVGGYVQLVTLADGSQLYCNEDGKLRGLPRNPLATALTAGSGLHPLDYICGVAVVLTGKRRWS